MSAADEIRLTRLEDQVEVLRIALHRIMERLIEAGYLPVGSDHLATEPVCGHSACHEVDPKC